MTQTFSVRNFERFQHYKDRSPPWIKLYNELLDDYRFAVLPDASKWHLVAIWLLASRSDNEIPADTKWIAGHIGATEQVDLTPLQDAGFIVVGQARAGALADGAQSAMPEREGETEAETEKEDSSGDPDASPPNPKPGKKTYPEPFEEFWRAYPTDALMSKSKAFEKWGRLTIADRAAALAALPGFRAHCAKDLTYRPVHAERFLSQRRFDGFAEIAAASADTGEGAELRGQWDGRAAALVDAIGPAKFAAWFSGTSFEPGPPTVLRVAKAFAAEWIRGHYAGDLKRLYGDIKIEVKA